jgi:hypothetical protein
MIIQLAYIDIIDSWEEYDKGHYFNLLANNAARLGCNSASYAFFAAEIACCPAATTDGWSVLINRGVLPSSTVPSPDIALDIHGKLPVPKTIDEVKSYTAAYNLSPPVIPYSSPRKY